MAEIGIPRILTDADTEPEAAHLRNVLRRVRQIADNDANDVLKTIAGICKDALKRPRTNGPVIDQLTKENGDLQSEIIDMQAQLSSLRASALPLPAPGDES
jgi:hypothetical protein